MFNSSISIMPTKINLRVLSYSTGNIYDFLNIKPKTVDSVDAFFIFGQLKLAEDKL